VATRSRYKAFYAPIEFDVIWEKFKEIARREHPEEKRGATSLLIRKLIEDYVRRKYELGNPQTRLDMLLEGKPLVPKPPPCEFAGGVSKGLVYCQRMTMWAALNHCWRCFRRQRTRIAGLNGSKDLLNKV